MDIFKIMRIKYAGKSWAVKGNSYEALEWLEENEPKPTEQELLDIWDSESFEDEVHNDEVSLMRRGEIMNDWPFHRQFEALTEDSMGRPEKLEELKNFIISTKEKYPKQ